MAPAIASCVASVVWFQSVTTSALIAADRSVAARPTHATAPSLPSFNLIEWVLMVLMDLFVVGESGRLITRVLASIHVHKLKRADLSKIFQIVSRQRCVVCGRWFGHSDFAGLYAGNRSAHHPALSPPEGER